MKTVASFQCEDTNLDIAESLLISLAAFPAQDRDEPSLFYPANLSSHCHCHWSLTKSLPPGTC